jgi:hypothetical protein
LTDEVNELPLIHNTTLAAATGASQAGNPCGWQCSQQWYRQSPQADPLADS